MDSYEESLGPLHVVSRGVGRLVTWGSVVDYFGIGDRQETVRRPLVRSVVDDRFVFVEIGSDYRRQVEEIVRECRSIDQRCQTMKSRQVRILCM